jgi:MFS family permease
VQIAAAVTYCLFAAGIVFGYAALKPVLVDEGAYSDRCPPKPGHEDDDTCVEIHLNLMFTVAAVATNVAALPIGAILDHFGPRVCGIISSVFLFCGAMLLAYAQTLPFDGFLLGYLLLALGGPFIFISSFQLSNTFPRHSGLILALLTGAFDSSSAIFLIYRIIYNSSGGDFDHRRFFLAYLVVPVCILALQLVLMPARSYKTVGELVDQAEEAHLANEAPTPVTPFEDQIDEETALLRDERRERRREERMERENVMDEIESLLGSVKGDEQLVAEERKNVASGVWGVMHDKTVAQQITSPWFILICLFTVVQMTRINYFVATIRPQYRALLGDVDKAVQINDFFDIALPVGGILAIPFIGVILDHTSTISVLSILVTAATLIGVLGVLPYMWAAYANIILFVLYRPFYYTAVSDYSAKVFGFRTFGTVYGLIICLSGLLNLSQSGLDVLFHRTFNGNPVPVNIILLTVGLAIGLSLLIFVAVRLRKMARG